MALINCPDCKTKISDKAETCPQCAYPLKSKQYTLEKNNEGCFLQTLNFGCMFGAIIFGIVILLFILSTIFS